MKVFVHDPWGIRGAGAYTYFLCESLYKQGVDVHLFTNYYYEFGRVSSFRISKPFFKYSENIRFKKIRKVIRGIEYIANMTYLLFNYGKNGPHVIHIQRLLLYQFDLIWLKTLRFILSKRKSKVVLTAHNILPLVNGERYKNIMKRIYSEVDAIIVHSSSLKRQVKEIFGKSSERWVIEVIPHGNEKMLFKKVNTAEIERLKQSIKKSHGGRKFLFLGVIHENKGLDILIQAWHRHVKKYPKDILYIVGKPQYNISKELKFIRNNLHSSVALSLGYKSDEEVLSYYLVADFVVLPYKNVLCQSGVLISALTIGKPVIATDVGAFKETVNLVCGGYIVNPNDPASLSKILDKASAISDTALIRWGNFIRKKMSEEFSWDKIAINTIKLYNKLFKFTNC